MSEVWQWDQDSYDDWIERLMAGMPESWDGDEAAEAIILDYLREIERRLELLGGSLERGVEVAEIGAGPGSTSPEPGPAYAQADENGPGYPCEGAEFGICDGEAHVPDCPSFAEEFRGDR